MGNWFRKRLDNLWDNIIFAVLVAGGVAVWSLISSLSAPIIFVLAITVLVVILLGINQTKILRERTKKKISKLSEKELYETIRGWVDKPYFKVQPDKADSAFFVLNVELSGKLAQITRMKDNPSYIEIGSLVVLAKEGTEVLSAMAEPDRLDLRDTIALELLRYGINYCGLEEYPLKKIEVRDSVPLDDWLTEHYFIQRIMFVMRAQNLVSGYFFHVFRHLIETKQTDSEVKQNAETSPKQSTSAKEGSQT